MVADCSTGKRKRSQSDGSDVCCKLKQTGVFEFFVVPDNAVRDYGILGDGAFYMGQSLRIREGPLKGYLCRVLTLRRSEYNNQVLTVTCELLGEVHGNNSASCTRMDPDSSSAKTELTGMQGWKEGIGSGAAEIDGWNALGSSAERTSCGQRINQSCNAFINEQSELGENNVSGVNNLGSSGRNWTWGSRSWDSSDRDCSVGRSSYRGGFHGRDNSDRGGVGGMGRVNDWTPWGGQSGCTSNREGRESFYRGDFCGRGGIGDRDFRCRGDSDRVSFGDRGCSDSGGFGRRACRNSCNDSGGEKYSKWGKLTNNDSGGWKGHWNSSNSTDEKSLDLGKQNSNDRWKGSWNSNTNNCWKSSDWGKQANTSNGWQGHDATKSWQPPITFCCGQGSGSNQSTLGNEASGDHHEKSSSWARRTRTDSQELTSSDAGNSWNEECSSTWIPAIASGASQGSGWNQSSHS